MTASGEQQSTARTLAIWAGIPMTIGAILAGLHLSASRDWSLGLLYLSLAVSFLAVEVVPLPMPRGASFRLVGGVAVAALLIAEPVAASACYLIGGSLALVIEQSPRAVVHALNMYRRITTMVVLSFAYQVIAPAGDLDARSLSSMIPALSVGGAYILADITGWALTNEGSTGSSGARSIRSLLQLFGSVYLGQVSVGIVLAVVYPSLGVIAFLVLVVLMLIMQHTFGLLLRIRSAYTRTVSALSRVAEMSEGGNAGHGERVATVAAELGRRMGLDGSTLERLTLASLVHDIGLVAMDEDERASADKRAVARAGADLISRVSFLAGLSPVVRSHAAPYSEYIDTRESDGVLARIVHVACEFDELTSGEAGMGPSRAVESMFATDNGDEFDPAALVALLDSIESDGA